MIAVVSHDAGGAEILSCYLCQQNLESICVLEGPARKIFERRLGAISISPLNEAIHKATSLLCGTSWQSDLELNAIRLARSLGKRSVAFLDHWANYRERFLRSGEACMPDEIWIGDPIAESMAANIFPSLPIRLVHNPYFEAIKRELGSISSRRHANPDTISVLYVCEPVREHGIMQFGNARHWGYVEEEALRYFLDNLAALGKSVDRILIRPHPSEPRNKYEWALHEYILPLAIGGSRTLVEEITDCDVVVGCESMAMVIGLLAGKRVISCIPPNGKTCILPHQEIESLQVLLKMSSNVLENRAVIHEC